MDFNLMKQLLKSQTFERYLCNKLSLVFAEKKEYDEVWKYFEKKLRSYSDSFEKSPVKLEEKDAALVHGLASKFLAKNIQQENIEDTPQTMLDIAYFFTLVGDTRLGPECIWGGGILALRNLARNMGKKLRSHISLDNFLADIDPNNHLLGNFDSLSLCHIIGFYEGDYDTKNIRIRIELAQEFINELKQIKLTRAQKEQIASTDYYNLI